MNNIKCINRELSLPPAKYRMTYWFSPMLIRLPKCIYLLTFYAHKLLCFGDKQQYYFFLWRCFVWCWCEEMTNTMLNPVVHPSSSFPWESYFVLRKHDRTISLLCIWHEIEWFQLLPSSFLIWSYHNSLKNWTHQF